jgi:hypothetical protein
MCYHGGEPCPCPLLHISFTMSFSDDSSYNEDSDKSYVDSDVEKEAQLPPVAAKARAGS